MNALALEMLLHYFYRATPFPSTTPSAIAARDYLAREQLIEFNTKGYVLTERGRAHMKALIDLPLPVGRKHLQVEPTNVHLGPR